MRAGSNQVVAAGSVRSDWILVRNAANSLVDSNFTTTDASFTSTSCGVINVPSGATRVLIRQAVDPTATVSTTLAVIRVVGVDGGGVPARIDAANFTDAGLSLAISNTATNNPQGVAWVQSPEGSSDLSPGNTYRWGSLSASFDMLGASRLFIQRTTASNHTGGTLTPTIAVLFLN